MEKMSTRALLFIAHILSIVLKETILPIRGTFGLAYLKKVEGVNE